MAANYTISQEIQQLAPEKKTKGCTRNKTQLQNTAEFFTE